MSDAEARCEAMNGALRCALRPHPLGDHLALVPEGNPMARVETWARTPSDGPELSGWLEAHGAELVPRGALLVAREDAMPAAPPPAGPPRDLGYTGDPCPTCGSIAVVRTGTCATCQSCGSTSGCG